MKTLTFIDYNDLPHGESGFSQLYRDYINDNPKVAQYFDNNFRSFDVLPKFAEMCSTRIQHRQILVDVLTEQNQQFGITSEKTFENIRSLASDATFAVVTGQQVGMLTGPLYTIYKTVTSIKLARQLSQTYPQFKFVPVFWLEGEDHDLQEVNHIRLLNSDAQPIECDYLCEGKPATKNYGAVGEITFDEHLVSFFESIDKILPHSEFKQPLIELLRTMYTQGTTFNRAFASLMNRLFDNEGLIFISSNDKRLKQLLSSIFIKELSEYPRVSQLIIEQSAELEERYHAQIKTKALNLFFFHKGGRYFIEPREYDFSLRGTRHFIPKDEIIRLATEQPELFSPNVALRPICQDTILPTFIYVAGPSETAYFAQLKKVYRYFGMTMPIIYPRASITLIEEKLERIMEKYQLGINDFIGKKPEIEKKVLESVSEIKIDEMFLEASRRVADLASEMKFGINYIDPTLIGALENTTLKIEQQLDVLKYKVVDAQKRKHEIALRQIAKVGNTIYPNANFQERELNIVHFINKHGFEIVRKLSDEIAIDQWKHQIIEL